jgi:hypothetical protein
MPDQMDASGFLNADGDNLPDYLYNTGQDPTPVPSGNIPNVMDTDSLIYPHTQDSVDTAADVVRSVISNPQAKDTVLAGTRNTPTGGVLNQADASGIDISKLLADTDVQDRLSKETAGAVRQNTALETQVLNDQADRDQKLAAAQGIVTSQQEGALLGAQQNAITAAHAAGTNISDPTNTVVRMLQQLNDATDSRDATAEQIANNRESAGGGILGAIVGGFKNIGMHKQLAEENDAVNAYSDSLQKLNSATQITAQTQKDLAPTRSQATVAASTAIESGKWQDAADTAKANALRANSQGLIEANTLGEQGLNNMDRVSSIAYRAAASEAMIAQRNERLKQARENADDMAAAANLSRQGMQYVVPAATVKTANRLPNKTILGEIAKGEDPKNSATPASIGYRIGHNLETTGIATLGPDIGDNTVRVVEAQIPPTQNNAPLFDLFHKAYDAGATGAVINSLGQVAPDIAGGGKAGNRAQVADRVGTNLTNLINQKTAEIDPRDNSNPFQAPDLNALSQSDAVKATPLYQTIIKPLVQTGRTQTDFDYLTSTAAAAVANKQLSFEDAAKGIQLLAKTAAAQNAATLNLQLYGIPTPKTYKAPISGIGALGGAKPVDMTSYTGVSNALAAKIHPIGYHAESVLSNTPQGRELKFYGDAFGAVVKGISGITGGGN